MLKIKSSVILFKASGVKAYDVLDEKKCEENSHRLPDSSSANFQRLDAKAFIYSIVKIFFTVMGRFN